MPGKNQELRGNGTLGAGAIEAMVSTTNMGCRFYVFYPVFGIAMFVQNR